jgi:hypothetical protein
VTHSIEQHDTGIEISQRAKTARIAEGEGRKREQDQISHDESHQPLAVLDVGMGNQPSRSRMATTVGL